MILHLEQEECPAGLYSTLSWVGLVTFGAVVVLSELLVKVFYIWK